MGACAKGWPGGLAQATARTQCVIGGTLLVKVGGGAVRPPPLLLLLPSRPPEWGERGGTKAQRCCAFARRCVCEKKMGAFLERRRGL